MTGYDSPVRCLSCQYPLHHLTAPRCPECGQAFDPNDRTTFDDDLTRRFLPRHDILSRLLISLVAAIASSLMLFSFGSGSMSIDAFIFAAVVGISILWPIAILIAFKLRA